MYQFPQPPREFSARNFTGAKRREVGGVHLAVDHFETPVLELAHQRHERHLGGIGDAHEHGFAEECAAERNAVQAADQFPLEPGFHRMREARAMQRNVGFDHRLRNPGAGLTVPRLPAALDHLAKSRIGAHLEARVAHGARQRARYLQLGGEQNHARIGAPPQDRLVLAEPRKDAVSVGFQQSGYRQVAAGGKQAVGVRESRSTSGKGSRDRARESRCDKRTLRKLCLDSC